MADKQDVDTDADVFMIGIIHMIGMIGMADGCYFCACCFYGCYLTTTLANDNY